MSGQQTRTLTVVTVATAEIREEWSIRVPAEWQMTDESVMDLLSGDLDDVELLGVADELTGNEREREILSWSANP